MTAEVVVVGSCVEDLVSYAERFPGPGESVRGHRFAPGFGGKGANQAVMAARLGASVAMVGCVGDDVFGPPTKDNFVRQGVNADAVRVSKTSSTGTATITVADSGENSIVVVLGANMELGDKDVQDAKPLLKEAKVLLTQLEVPTATTLAALKLGTELGLTTVLNPAPGLPGLSDELLRYASVVCPNEGEAAILSGLKVSSVEEAKAAALAIRAKGGKVVVVTLGPSGCVYLDEGQDAQPQHIPCPKVEAKDTTGAGDGFVGAFAYFTAKRPDLGLRDKLERSLKVASESVKLPGTQASYKPRDQLPSELFQ